MARSQSGRYRLSCDEIVFQGHSQQPISVSFTVFLPDTPTIPGSNNTLHIMERLGGKCTSSFGKYFDLVENTDRTGMWGYISYLRTLPTITIQVNLTCKPQDNGRLLPDSALIFVETTDLIVVPIRYIFTDQQPQVNPAVGGGLNLPVPSDTCTQCNRKAHYCCDKCNPTYRVCLRCTRLYGREIHVTHFGEGHQMNIIPNSTICSKCTEAPIGMFNMCMQCERQYPDKAILCMSCFSNHQNIDQHTGEGDGTNTHDFRVVNIDVDLEFLGLQEPQVYYHLRTARPTCSECKSKIGLEFLRCGTCMDAYNLCDRCADGGGIGRHRYHHLEYMIPTIGNPPPAQANANARGAGGATGIGNPESIR